MQTRIRTATKKDAASIARVEIETYRSTYRALLPESYLSTLSVEAQKKRWVSRLKERSTFILVAEQEQTGKILGYIYAGPTRKHDPDHRGEVYAIYILPDHQRAGIGRTLIRFAAERLSRVGVQSLVIWVLSENPARNFYEALGGDYLRSTVHEVEGHRQEGVAYGWKNIAVLYAHADTLPTKDQELLSKIRMVFDSLQTTLRPEIQLLLACARTTLSKQTTERITALAQQITEWPYLLRAAQEHGIRPAVYRNFNSICADIVPVSVVGHFRRVMLSNAARNVVLSEELLRLLDGFKEQGILAIPFKGPALGSLAYHDTAMRESSDLDILIQDESLSAAKTFLINRGYHPRSSRHADSAHTGGEEQERYHVFVHPTSPARVDLQIALEAPHFSFRLNDRNLWSRVTSQRFGERAVSSFSLEDLLILLCVHGTKDLWCRIKWICDIAELIDSHKEFDWSQVIYEATRLHARRKLFLGCFLSYHLMGARVPEEILVRLSREPGIEVCAAAVIERLSLQDRTVTDFERVELYFRTDDTLWDKTKRFLRYVFLYFQLLVVPTNNDRRFINLPPWLSNAYYLVRPIRIVAKYGTKPHSAWNALRRGFEHLD